MDTIVALSTPWGRSGVGVIRISGPEALTIAQTVCGTHLEWVDRRASVRSARDDDGQILDEVLTLWMKGPKSFTGEDVVEISAHGNPVILASIIDRLIRVGARPARPGEFTRQALLNGRADLLQAEAINALIHARSIAGVRDAVQGLGGELSGAVASMTESLLDVAAELEARLDHPDDDLSLKSDELVAKTLASLSHQAEEFAASWTSSKVRQAGATVAIVGPVNAGKSSLFNHLVGVERALVSARPGTTRDVVERAVLLDGLDITFMDTAGEGGTDDPLEAAGVALGRSLSDEVDLVLVVVPTDRAPSAVTTATMDRTQAKTRLIVGSFADEDPHSDAPQVDYRISNLNGGGIEELRSAIRKQLGALETGGEVACVLSQRQHDLFRAVARCTATAEQALLGILGPAVAATETVMAIERLGELVGMDAKEAVLDRLFSRFCIGK